MGNEPDSLVVWGLSTFHAALLVAVLVTLLYVYAPLGKLLQGLSTIVGLAVYLVLWATTWWTTRAALRRESVLEGATTIGVVEQGIAWGAITGVIFLLGIVLLVLTPQFLPQGYVVSLAFISAIGSVVAFVIGALVGGMFALIDVFLFRLTGLVILD